MELNLDRPIVFFDLETTGLQIGKDHIVEICLHKVLPSHDCQTIVRRVRPADAAGNTLHIPAESTAIHGISDSDVAGEPTFREMAAELRDFIADSDLAGYNSNKFDVPMLVEEFLRAGVAFSVKGRRLVDVQNIFHKMEQRTLKAAMRFYCGRELEDAHSADADTLATYEVLKAQLERYDGVEYIDEHGHATCPVVNDVEALSRFSGNSEWADLCGHIGYDRNGNEVFRFGKHKGLALETVFTREPAYYDWLMKADFPLSTKEVVSGVWQRMKKRELNDLKLHFEGK